MGKFVLQSEYDPLPDLDLNLEDLDEENRRQAILYGKFSKRFKAAYIKQHREELALSILKDELSQDIEENKDKWKISTDKKGDYYIISEALINRILFRNEKFVKQFKKAFEAKAERKEWEGMLEACKQKSISIGRALKEREQGLDE